MSRRRILVTATGIIGVGAVVSAALGLDSGGNAGAAPTAPAPSTAPVTRTTLVDQVRLAGKIDYGLAQPFASRIAGTITALPEPGTVLKAGAAALRIDDQPVVLLLGKLPAYRALAEGVSGPDVKQFEENLKALGYGGFKVDAVYDKDTAAAVKKWQKASGMPESGTVDLGRVTYTEAPARVAEHKQHVGDTAAPGTPVLTTTGTTRSVSVTLEEKQAALAKTGTKVLLQSAGATPVEGTMTQVGAAQNGGQGEGGGGGGGGGKTQVTVTPSDPSALGGNDGDAVDVTLKRGERKDVLTVPIVALLAVRDGYGIEVIGPAGRHIVPVTVGMFAQGRVEVSGPGLAEGTDVGVAGS
ncbi:peptidoglycan-binding protein [Kitasatospora sp. NPDC057223]|uniref:peptidoglycan-binding protein n=1 Tax=Kitasatospora sp. NPDC057223 TaxID=3346055 RepID=UPI003645502F